MKFYFNTLNKSTRDPWKANMNWVLVLRLLFLNCFTNIYEILAKCKFWWSTKLLFQAEDSLCQQQDTERHVHEPQTIYLDSSPWGMCTHRCAHVETSRQFRSQLQPSTKGTQVVRLAWRMPWPHGHLSCPKTPAKIILWFRKTETNLLTHTEN